MGERVAQERLEQDRLAERREQERLAQLKQARQAQLEQERQEQERLEQERLAQLEHDSLAHFEQERQEQERPEQERQEQERQEQERMAQLEQERLEQERLAQDERENHEQQRLEQEELFEPEEIKHEEETRLEGVERREENTTHSIGKERVDQHSTRELDKRATQIDLEKAINGSDYPEGPPAPSGGHEKLDDDQIQRHEIRDPAIADRIQESQLCSQTQEAKEATTTSAPTPAPDPRPNENVVFSVRRAEEPDNTKICIRFKVREEGNWKDVSILSVDPFDPSQVESVANQNIRNGMRPFDTDLRLLTPKECYSAVIADGTNTILLMPNTDIDINDELLTSASEVRVEELSRPKHILKRITTDNISQLHHVRKKQNGRVLVGQEALPSKPGAVGATGPDAGVARLPAGPNRI